MTISAPCDAACRIAEGRGQGNRLPGKKAGPAPSCLSGGLFECETMRAMTWGKSKMAQQHPMEVDWAWGMGLQKLFGDSSRLP